MKYIVYCTTNIKNSKIYVGVHKTEDPNIFDGYLGNGINRYDRKTIYNPKRPFEFAVKKYGFDSFRRATIKEFDTLQEALDLEAEIVDENFIKRSDTYNITLGGGLPPILNKVIYQYDLQGNFIKEWKSIVEAAKFLHVSESCIGKAVLYKRTSAKYLWSDIKIDKLNIDDYNIYSPEIKIYLYDDFGDYVMSFNSLNDCVRSLNTCLSHVQRSIKTGVKTKGYYISTELVGKYEKPKVKRLTGMIHQYSLEGDYIQSFNSIKDAEKALGIKLKGINDSIKQGYSYKGYLWLRGQKEDFVKPVKAKSKARKIGQYTMDDKFIKSFNSLREARKDFPNVSKVLNGSAKHCHNYKFKYLD